MRNINRLAKGYRNVLVYFDKGGKTLQFGSQLKANNHGSAEQAVTSGSGHPCESLGMTKHPQDNQVASV